MTANDPKSDAAPPLVGTQRAKHLPLIGTQRVEAPVSVPARMLNEVMYCERLMYLEWVQGEFEDNYFTVDGRHVHERADAAGGRLPAPREHDDDGSEEASDSGPYQARSVWLTSESLGITAKIDIVDSDGDGKVMPVEYKRGKAPDPYLS
jgi:CRISP-associated protein Cas1